MFKIMCPARLISLADCSRTCANEKLQPLAQPSEITIIKYFHAERFPPLHLAMVALDDMLTFIEETMIFEKTKFIASLCYLASALQNRQVRIEIPDMKEEKCKDTQGIS